jgi:hypothetical protein
MITTDGWKYQGKYINKLHQEFSGLFPHERYSIELQSTRSAAEAAVGPRIATVKRQAFFSQNKNS